ncbi:competence protein CoiA family protein [Lentibacillus sp. L22]|uniref:competence protein CoiA n=1 Tax=Lentibacillus TaxID=175304 RepID=UPI0022B12B2C|nr:competence protein CoiA family protein [Lentibacillus daqui]
MLQAITKDGKRVTLAPLTKTEITGLKVKEKFFCPICRERVIIKAGTKTIPHFAHHTKGKCPAKEGGEGTYHEKGKLILYEWLKWQRLDVELEVYLPEIKQRPDLLVTIHQKKIAIEYQCARISVTEVLKRNQGYQKLGIQPIWIIGANHFRRQSQHHIKLDHFLRQFLHQFSSHSPLTGYFFSPDTQTFIIFQDIYITGAQQAIGILQFNKLRDMIFTTLFSRKRLSRQQLFALWQREKRHFRLRPRDRLSRDERSWYQWLYLKRTHLEYLPSIIHLPIPAQYRMRSPLWNWQSRICLEILHPLPIGGHVSVAYCMYLLRKHMIPIRDLPLIHSHDQPIHQYLLLLTQLHILKQESTYHFTKQRHFKFYKNVEEALKGDEALLKMIEAGNQIEIRA